MSTGDQATGDSEGEERPGPGRPRIAELDDRILAAAVSLLDADSPLTVAGIVERSGVSRAAIYRRWPSISQLHAAALDVGRTRYREVPVGPNLREALFAALMPEPRSQHEGRSEHYSERRLRQRLRLILEDPELQKAYWESHISRRRAPLEAALQEAVRTGMLREDLEVAACVDALAGTVYYQFVGRGDDIHHPETRHRVQQAFDVVWRGMQPEADVSIP